MVDIEKRKRLQELIPNEQYWYIGNENQGYDKSIIGIKDNRLVYDYYLMIEEFAEDEDTDLLEAQEFIDYNVIRALGYFQPSPIVVFKDEDNFKYYDLEAMYAEDDEKEEYLMSGIQFLD